MEIHCNARSPARVLVATLLVVAGCGTPSMYPGGSDDYGGTGNYEPSSPPTRVRGLRLPWPAGETYRVSGYPHASGSSRYCVDFALPIGTAVVAMRSGVVTLAVDAHSDFLPSVSCNTKACNEGTNYLVIDSGDGREQHYVHLQQHSLLGLAPGTRVAQGQTVAHSGHNGWSTGPHLHACDRPSGSSSWGEMWGASNVMLFEELGDREPEQGEWLTSQNAPPASTQPPGSECGGAGEQCCTGGCDDGLECRSGRCATRACPSGTGLYCGASVGLEASTLYACDAGHFAIREACAYGCRIEPPGQNDRCAPPPVCPSGDGYYCGGPAGLDASTLYYCRGGTYTPQQACARGCEVRPPGYNDRCS